MSMLMGYINKDRIVMSSDSRHSIRLNRKTYALNDDAQKLYQFNSGANKTVLFGSGSTWVISSLAERMRQNNIRDIHKIVKIAAKLVEVHKGSGGTPCSNNGYIQLVIGQIVDGKTYIHMSSDSLGLTADGNWNILTKQGDDEILPFFCGSGCEIGSEIYYASKEQAERNFNEVAKLAFDTASSTNVGGTLEIIEMSLNGIAKRTYPIDDTEKVINKLPRHLMKFASNTGGVVRLGGTDITESMFRATNGRDSSFFNSNFDASNNIDGGAVRVGTLNADRIMANTITANQIMANAITANHIMAGAIGANHIQAGAITTDKLAANSITADMIRTGTLSGVTINVDTDASVGNWLTINSTVANSGIRWRGGAGRDAMITTDIGGAFNFNASANFQGVLTVNGRRVLTE